MGTAPFNELHALFRESGFIAFFVFFSNIIMFAVCTLIIIVEAYKVISYPANKQKISLSAFAEDHGGQPVEALFVKLIVRPLYFLLQERTNYETMA